ncbi:MAG: hypothetical protein ACRDKI_12370, partial [Solirubrobacterales bacterium]
MTEGKLPYKTYRARKRPWDRFKRSSFDELRGHEPKPGEPDYPAPPPASSRGDAQPAPAPRRPRPGRSAP